jgi:hypothetical protein
MIDLSRPSEKFGTHSTRVLGIREKDKGRGQVSQLGELSETSMSSVVPKKA